MRTCEGIREGNDAVTRVVATAFVQDLGSQSRDPSFVEAWPSALRAELELQRPWQSHSRERQFLAVVAKLAAASGAALAVLMVVPEWAPGGVVEFVIMSIGMGGMQWALRGTRVDLRGRRSRKMRS
jgi:hypothetical protein